MVISTAAAERFGPGVEANEFMPGDFILAHRHNFIAGLISQAQKRRFKGADAAYAHWSHSALIIEQDGTLVEAEANGVRRNAISRYREDEYHLVRLGSDFSADARKGTIAFANQQVGQGFGFLDMFGASVYLLTGLPLRLVRSGHEICSGLVVTALQAGGLLSDLDPALTLPADLAKRFGVRP
jgi:uncharacterized protein YycO